MRTCRRCGGYEGADSGLSGLEVLGLVAIGVVVVAVVAMPHVAGAGLGAGLIGSGAKIVTSAFGGNTGPSC